MPINEDALEKIAGGLAQTDPEAPPRQLFRREALDAAASTGLGRPVNFYPTTWLLLGAGLLVMVTVLGFALATGNYNRKETVGGIVRSVGGEVKVIAPSPGLAARVYVTEGQRVQAGEPILAVTTGKTGMDGRPADATSLVSIDREIASLTARLDALDASGGVEQRGRATRLASLESELRSARMVEEGSRERLSLAEHALARIMPVAEKGFISGETMRQRQMEIISLRDSAAQARGQQASLAGQIGELSATRDQQPFALAQEKGRLLDLIAGAQRERESFLAQQGYIVKAPAAGTVTALQVAAGQAVDPQRPLMVISSEGGQAVAEVYVPSRAVGFLEQGQKVRIRYDAFPYQRFGAATGHVKAVSATVLRPEELQAPMEVREPMYRVLVSLDRGTVKAYGRDYRVQPGFALTADIILEERSFMSWLLDPLISLRGRL
jgi:membrane fusion protein